MIRMWLLLLAVLAGCGRPALQQPDRAYQNTRLQFRNGKLREALLEVDRSLATLASRAGPLWHARFLLLKSEILVALGRPGDVLKTLDGQIQPGADIPEVRARWLIFRGRAKTMLRDFDEAGRLLREGLRLASEINSAPLIAEAQSMRISLFIRLRDWTSAETSAQEGLVFAQRAGDSYLQALALGNLGNARMFNSRDDEAIPWYEQSASISEKHGHRFLQAIVRHNLGICYKNVGDSDKALQLLSQAERDYAEIGDLIGQERCFGDMGNAHLARGDLSSAISSHRKALDLARQLQDPDDVARCQNNLAEALIESGNLDSAEISVREAVALRQKVRDERAAVWSQLNSAQIAGGRGRSDEAERLYGETISTSTKLGMNAALLKARAKLGSLYLEMGTATKAEVQFKAIVAESESRRSALRRDDWKLTFQSSVIPFYEDYIDFLIQSGRAAQALEVAEASRARLLAEKVGLQRKIALRATATDLRAKARSEGALLFSYWLAPRRSFLWVVAPDKIHPFILPPEKEIAELVETYKNLVLQSRDPLETANSTGVKLFEVLVSPARKLLHPAAKVIIVPDGPLHELNFETLLVGGERPRYWIEDATVTIAPSLAVLQPADESARGRRRLLLLGNPVSPLPDYPQLPASEHEIANIQNFFTAEEKMIVTGHQAHPGAYREAGPANFSLIHFSAHAVANAESPLDSAVILSRNQDSYKLYARDVAAMPLSAGLVTISACRGAGAKTYSGEGLVGFAWAFMQAGASNVIAGLWDVNDRSTSQLMIHLYRELVNGLGPAEALRSAKLALVRSGGPYRKPYYWAPFQVYSRSGPFSTHLIELPRRH
jgi:CHAT domain-containing protein